MSRPQYRANQAHRRSRDVPIDPELLSRPSWVDARVAYNQVKKGRAFGNTCALWIRWQLQKQLFNLGAFIQKHCGKVLFLGLMFLSLSCIGLKTVYIETDVDKLWVEAGGRLENELEYTEKTLGKGSGASHEMIIQTPADPSSSILSPQSMLRHLQALDVATGVTVHKFGTTWRLSDLCYATNFPSFDEGGYFESILQHFVPCMVITPLDCFWEGSKLLGPQNPVQVPGYSGSIKWSNLDPMNLTRYLNQTINFFPGEQFIDFLQQAGVSDGYQSKPCLNPYDAECPVKAPNYHTKELPDVAAEVSGGCSGFASRYMHWEEDLIIGGAQRTKHGRLKSAAAIQSLILLMGEKDFYDFHHDTRRVLSIDWTPENARSVLHDWQREFVSEVTRFMTPEEDTLPGSQSKPSHQNGSVSNDKVLPFATASLLDILKDFSEISVVRVVMGYLLMIVYACISLLRWSDPVQSQSGIGIAGVLLCALSVAAGLGLCSVLGINFNASTTQIVPFLALGLGVDDMFLIAHTYAEHGQKPEIAFSEQTGECLKRVGVSVLLTSLANMTAFFLAAIIPIPALRSFCLQVGVLIVFNLATVLLVFPAVVSVDLVRRREQKVDVFCCFTGSSPSRVVDLQAQLGSLPSQYYEASPSYTVSRSPQRSHTTITHTQSDGSHPVTILAPPEYDRYIPSNAVAPMSMAPGSLPPSTTSSRQCLTNTGEPVTCHDHCARTHKDCCAWTLTRFAKSVYSPTLEKTPVKIFVILAFLIMTIVGIIGTIKVEDGLDMTDVVPRDTNEYHFLDAQSKYFGFYNFYAVTKGGFNYADAKYQRLLRQYHEAFQHVENIIKKEDGSLPDFWLIMMRDWLKGLQDAFDRDKRRGCFSQYDYYNNASVEGILAFKLLVQTGDIDSPVDRNRVHSGRLVDDDGIIYPPAFYCYVTAWTSNDPVAYGASQSDFHPIPRQWDHDLASKEMLIPKSLQFTFAQLPFYLHNMGNTAAVTSTVKEIRAICEKFEEKGLPNFPRGVPFTFWEQYVHLRFYLFLSLLCVLAAIFIVITVILLNPWAAIVVVVVLSMMLVQLFGMMGFLGIKLSAVPAVILIVSVGIGVEFTVHVTMGFLTAIGTRNKRMRMSLQHVFSPVIHGAMTTLLGVIMLAGSEYDFIVRYFFVVLTVLVVIGLLNGLLLLPVLLSILGPSPEVIPAGKADRLAPPSPDPSPPPPPPRQPTRSSRRSYPPRVPSDISLTTITEEPSQYSSQDSHISVRVQPEVIVETSVPGGDSGQGRSSSGSSRNSTPPESRYAAPPQPPPPPQSYTRGPIATVKATTKVKVEVHGPVAGSSERDTEYKSKKRKPGLRALPPLPPPRRTSYSSSSPSSSDEELHSKA